MIAHPLTLDYSDEPKKATSSKVKLDDGEMRKRLLAVCEAIGAADSR